MIRLPEVLYAEFITSADDANPSLARALQRDCRTDGACIVAVNDDEYGYYTVSESLPPVPSVPSTRRRYKYRMTDPRRYACQIKTGELLLMCGKQCYALVPYHGTDTHERTVEIVFW